MDARAYTYLDHRLGLVETEVAYLRRLLAQATRAQAAPVAQDAQAAVAGPPGATPPGKPARSGFSLEAFVVGRGLQIAGLIVLLLGTALFLSLTIAILDPAARVLGGLAASVALLVGGAAIRRERWRFFGDGVIALGGGVGFLSIWSATALFALVQKPAALIALVAVTGVVAALSYARRSERLAIASALGAYLAPLLLGVSSFDTTTLFGYLFVVSGGWLALSRRARFRYLDLAAFVGILPYGPFFHVSRFASGTDLARGLAFTFALFAEFAISLHVAARRDGKLTSDRIGVVAACVGAFALSLETQLDAHRTILGGSLFLLAAALLASVRFGSVPAVVREAYAWLGLGSVTIGLAALTPGRDLTIVWSIEAAVVTILGARSARPRIAYAGIALYAVAFLQAFVGSVDLAWLGDGAVGPWALAFEPAGTPPFFNDAFLTLATLAAAGAVAEASIRRSGIAVKSWLTVLLQIATHVAGLTALTTEIYDIASSERLLSYDPSAPHAQRAQFCVSLLWTLYASTLFGFGLKNSLATLRYLAIALFVLTIGKVFTIDLAFLDVIQRFFLSLVLGPVLIGASVLYQRAAARAEG